MPPRYVPAPRQERQAASFLKPIYATSPLSRVCPRCETPIGRPCRRWLTSAAYWKPLKYIHPERKTIRTDGS